MSDFYGAGRGAARAAGRRAATAPALTPSAAGMSAAFAFASILLAAAPAPSAAQTATPFAGFKHDASQPIEIGADSLEVKNAENKAIFRGNVDVKQGVVRMRARVLEITYRRQGGAAAVATGGEAGAIDRLIATGDVIISNGKESARAHRADYDVAKGAIVLSGNAESGVLLVQGESAVKSQRVIIDLATGTATLSGGGGGRGRVTIRANPSAARTSN